MNKLQEIIDYFECGDGYDKNEVIMDVIGEIKPLDKYVADEIALKWDGKTLMGLDAFATEFYDRLIARVCNVVRSFESEDSINLPGEETT